MTKLDTKCGRSIATSEHKQEWANLIDNDLQCSENRHDELLDRIKKRTGGTPEALEKAIDEFTAMWGCD